jgi:hypothetical protein
MPILKNSEDLNGLNKAKRIVNRHLRRNFRGQENAVDGGTSASVAGLYDTFIKLLVAYKATLFELNTSFSLTTSVFREVVNAINDNFDDNASIASSSSASPFFNISSLGSTTAEERVGKIADRFVGASSKMIQQTAELSAYLSSKLNNTFRYFSPQQVSEISDQINEINGEYTNIIANIDGLEQGTDDEIAFNHIVDSWKKPAGLLIQRFTALLNSYTQGKSQSLLVEPDPAGRGMQNPVGLPLPRGAGYCSDSDECDDEPVFTVGRGMQMPTRYL